MGNAIEKAATQYNSACETECPTRWLAPTRALLAVAAALIAVAEAMEKD